MKRTRDTLTGGSKDVNPQIMVINVTQSGVDTPSGTAQALPIPRLPIAKGRSLVIELLAVTFINPSLYPGNVTHTYALTLSTNPAIPTNLLSAFSDPRALAIWHSYGYFLAATSEAAYQPKMEKHIDLTDEAGHGILVATDQIYLYCLTTATAQTNAGIARIEYRFKDVTLEEYIGIVQSQQ